ncbi:crinkler CRN family protein [Gigaspora margarita]|uniref:Crinkler CRN family protein n=1 Tax=Gigaspora margarita TaxID=4874 RepID=A0A8H3XFV9_GIGMA|nr:crinkler CRN family protein [Gigaspora margarita]
MLANLLLLLARKTVFCIVYGDKPESAFPVDVKIKDTALTIGHLKEVIREKIHLPAKVKAKDITLWKADIQCTEEDIRWDNLILENNEETGFLKLLPIRKVSEVFDVVPDNCINIIIEVLHTNGDSQVSFSTENIENLETMIQKIESIYAYVVDEEESITFSNISSKKFDQFLELTGLKIKNLTKVTKDTKDINPYKWTSHAENEANQQKNLLKYFANNLGEYLPNNIDIVDVSNHKNLLNIKKSRWFPCHIKGGTDFILVDEGCANDKMLVDGIYGVIELKKQLDHKSYRQAILEMVAADLRVGDDVKVFGILTDMRNWTVYWLDESKRIMSVNVTSCRKAFGLIGQFAANNIEYIGNHKVKRTKFLNVV